MTAKNSAEKPATVETVVEKAKEEKLVTVVPPQGDIHATAETEVVDGSPEQDELKLEVIEGGKKSLKERLSGVKSKLHEHRKIVAAVGSAVITVAAIAVAKHLKNQAEAEIVEEELVVEPEPLIDEQAESIKQDLEAAEIGG